MHTPQQSQPGTAATHQTNPGTDSHASKTTDPNATVATLDGSPDARQPSKSQRLAHMLKTGKPLKIGEAPNAEPAGAGTQGEDDSRGSDSKPKKFNELSERLGLELAELYGLEVATSADGKPVTVEMLKDHYSKRSEFSVSQLRWEEDRARQNADLVRGNAELRELLSAIPRDKLDPKVLETVRTRVEANAKRERARTLEVIPDWRDQELMGKELAEMGEWLEGFGYQKGYLATVYDHRAMNMMRTAWKREQLVKAALEEIEKDPPAPMGKGKPQGKPPSKPRTGPIPKGRAGLESLLQE